MNRLPRWRLGLAILALAGMAGLLAEITPVYVRNLRLQSYVGGITQIVENREKPDDVLRQWVVDKARALNLPVTADNVHIERSPENVRIRVRYAVRVDLPGYTVDLHFGH